MYWPISTPRVYVETTAPTPANSTNVFDDESRGEAGYLSVPARLDDGAIERGDEPSPTPVTPCTPGVVPVDHSAPGENPISEEDDENRGIDDFVRSSQQDPILALRVSRSGHFFAIITTTSLTIWQSKPTVVLAKVVRSPKSLVDYGSNVSLLIRPDSAIFVVQTSLGYLITYSLAFDPGSRVYRPQFPDTTSVNARRQSVFTGTRDQEDCIFRGTGEGGGALEVSIRFRMVIKIDAGICEALALEDELVVATQQPAAIQCIRWIPDGKGSQTSTELIKKMGWLPPHANVVHMCNDRPMNLSTWILNNGEVYAVQRIPETSIVPDTDEAGESDVRKKSKSSKKLFRGYCFHLSNKPGQHAIRAAINAKFSLIAVGCDDGGIVVYTAKDYTGNIPLSHRHYPAVSGLTTGALTVLSYSPDGYCLFAGYEHGWATWSVYGKTGGTSFGMNHDISESNGDEWLMGISQGVWIGGGSEILLIGRSNRIWSLEFARSAATSCYSSASLSRTMLYTTSSVMIYQGYDMPDLTSISTESTLWHTAQIPPSYLAHQWPIRCSVISPDGRYVAVAGRRGLAHYSVTSGRWKTFVNSDMENEFQIRGGMCWYRHILVAAVEAGDAYGLQLYSREQALDNSLVVHSKRLPAPIVLMSTTGQDSLLVYTHDNLLYHFVFAASGKSVGLVQVGQIAFNGILRSPARVRGLSWILPEEQLLEDDVSRDVAVASVLFLIDGKLVLLQPSFNDEGKLKYDLRVIVQNVEYYVMIRDLPIHDSFASMDENGDSEDSGDEPSSSSYNILRDSLWVFDGEDLRLWPDVLDVLQHAPSTTGRDLPPMVSIPVDFYPLSILLDKGITLGLESELLQRRDVNFSSFRCALRTHLFLPQVLRHYLTYYDTDATLQLADTYRDLQYFAHALEILLHHVLDEEVDSAPAPATAFLPTVLSFLSSFPQYLDIIVQCTRKTEVRSWRTLFAYLPPPAELFEETLNRGSLKTAGGYLLVLHTFEELGSSSEQLVRLLGKARDAGDWELCKELARFLVALDGSGDTLRDALAMVDLRTPRAGKGKGRVLLGEKSLEVPQGGKAEVGTRSSSAGSARSAGLSPLSPRGGRVRNESGAGDYFTTE